MKVKPIRWSCAFFVAVFISCAPAQVAHPPDAKDSQAHRDAVAVAITNKSVIPGMTPDEVKQALGKPEQESSGKDASGATLTWSYTTYRQDPQYTYYLDASGHAQLQIYYVKVAVGRLMIDFANGAVTRVTPHKVDLANPAIVTN